MKPCTKGELRPQERAGLVYEERFAKYCSVRWGGDHEIWAGQWLEFRDKNYKLCWAQPDVVMLNHDKKICYIFECKLTYRPVKAYNQLTGLYLPLLETLYPGYRMRLLQVFKLGTKRVKKEMLIEDLDAPELATGDHAVYAIWNWRPIPL